ncbi:two-component system response regulator RssB [Enterobacillus tribolii]|uniref:Regulator of RpoS n=1 Tax=Enterobacillus tribolii TaxID=1487935 RepID=A0A370R591_9GAMM|nr:two-component system response regulator RssB [Enterobacillus tribolii]MBW7983240.1 two-component system response regulator RssB [Enterobacillus tribolii]RDK97295.1 two-component system response regulator [Enterobacillus tribolii]
MAQPLAGKRILIVEDDAVFRSVLAGFLKAQEAEVCEAENGVEALAMQSEQVPDAILCDLFMPEMGGIEFIRRLRESARQTPVIVISATERMADVASVLRFGVQDVLLKPIKDLNQLRDALLACFYPDMFTSPALAGEALSHDWEALSRDPDYAAQLLKQLQPPVQQHIAGCKINYRQLTSHEHPGLVLDIAGLSENDLAFYCLDVTRAGDDGVLAALMIRTLFNGLLREQLAHHENRLPQMSVLLKQVNQMLRQAGLQGQFPLLAGYYHAGLGNLILVSAGLHAKVGAGDSLVQLNSGVPLGTMGSIHINQVSQHCTKWQCQIWGAGGHLHLMLTNQNNRTYE